ncbi:MAG: deoxyribonuclease IV [Deltaproteobacteria bacterium]|nr:deoxyribonuclease IV [Candidatus Zymogenaceae bacterium]
MRGPLLGAHVSISGGVVKAPERAAGLFMNAFQIFTKNSNQWAAKPIGSEDAAAFREAVRRGGFKRLIAHTDYLINPASANDVTAARSVESLRQEIERCQFLGIDMLVMHPGSHGGTGQQEGIRKLGAALGKVLGDAGRVTILLETTAGQGNGIGNTFEQLAEIVEKSGAGRHRIGICYDTCHTFAAGYDIRTRDAYERTMESFKRVMGIERLRAFHLNDSKKGLGSRVDRHQHIGWGEMGLDPFRLIMNDPRFHDIPKIIETPKEGNPEVYDRINLDTLLGLIDSE